MKAYARDFRAIAAALKGTDATLGTVKAVASVLAGSNPAFDRERFIQAAHDSVWAQIEAAKARTLPLMDDEARALVEDCA